MNPKSPFRTSAVRPFALLLLVCAVCGCQDEDKIRRYEVARPEIPPVDTVAAADVKTRILGAVIERPNGGYWFVKLMGDAAEVNPHAHEVGRFLRSLKVDEANQEKPISWTLPEGWTPGKGNQFSLAAFNVGTAAKPLEITISGAGGQLLSNLNRWRGQVGLKPISENQIPQVAEKLPLEGTAAAAYAIDFQGPGSSGGDAMMPPFLQGK